MCLFLWASSILTGESTGPEGCWHPPQLFTVMFRFIWGVFRTLFRMVLGIFAFVAAILIDSTPD